MIRVGPNREPSRLVLVQVLVLAPRGSKPGTCLGERGASAATEHVTDD